MKYRTIHKALAVLALLLLPALLAPAVTWPLKVSSNGRYLTDSNGVPFFFCGDNGWGTVVNISKEEAHRYITNRAALGVNAIFVRLVQCRFQTLSFGNLHDITSPQNYYGDEPFSTPDDWGTPNTNYFEHAKWVFDCAKTNNMAVIVSHQYLGINAEQGFYDEIIASGTNDMLTYGRFLGNMFKDQGNIIWCNYGDRAPGSASEEIEFCTAGIKEYDTNHLFTAHCTGYSSLQADGTTWLDIDSLYSSIKLNERPWAVWENTPTRPCLVLDFYYENDSQQVSAYHHRTIYWRQMSSGGICGFHLGNVPIWYTGTDTPNGAWTNWFFSQYRLEATNVNIFMTNRQWWKLVPDIDHLIVTNGYGTMNDTGCVSSAFSSSSNWGYSYLPTGGTIGVKMDYFSIWGTNIVTSWINPSNGAISSRATNTPSGGKNFTSPSRADWILAFDQQSGPQETWYIDIDQTGSGNNTGTNWANAWTNLAWALTSNSMVNAGATIYISGGTYTGAVTWGLSKGTISQPITLKASAEAGHSNKVLLNGSLSLGTGSSHIIIDGSTNDNYASLLITNTPNVVYLSNNANIKIDSESVSNKAITGTGMLTNITLRWLEIATWESTSNKDDGSQLSGIYFNPSDMTNITIEYCWVHHTGQDGIAHVNNNTVLDNALTVHHCLVEQTGDDGMVIQSGSTVHHNILRNTRSMNGHPDGLETFGHNTYIYNNIFYDWNTVPCYNTMRFTPQTNMNFYGNLIYSEDYVDSQETPMNVGYNASYPNETDTNSIWRDVVIANNTFVAGGSGPIQDGPNWVNRFYPLNGVYPPCICTNINWTIANNIFLRGSSFGVNMKGPTLDGFEYTTNDMLFNYNIVSASAASGFKTTWRDVEYSTVMAMNTATQYKSNYTNFPQFQSLGGFDFRLATNDTAAIDMGTNLASFATRLPGFTNDLWGNARGYNGKWDVGANEYTGPIPDTEKLYLHLTFEDDFSDGQVNDLSGYSAHMLNFGWTNTGTNLWMNWPSNVTGKVGTWAAEFIPNYSNSNLPGWSPTFHDGDYGSVTNCSHMMQLTQATFMVWAYFYPFPVAKTDDHQGTWIDSGYATNGTWRFGRDESSTWGNPRFSFMTNDTPVTYDYRFYANYPTNCSGVNWTTFESSNWCHYAAVVDCTDGDTVTVALYLNANNITNYTYTTAHDTNKVAFLTISDDGSASWTPWLGVGVWSHNTGIKKPPLNDGDDQPNTGWLNGKMDNLRIYGRALSASEILTLYQSESGEEAGNPASLTIEPTTLELESLTNSSPGNEYYTLWNSGDTNQLLSVTNTQSGTWFTMSKTNLALTNQNEISVLSFDTSALGAGSYAGYITNRGFTNGVLCDTELLTIFLDVTNGVEIAQGTNVQKAALRGSQTWRGNIRIR